MILVTGAAGTVGTRLTRALVARGEEVRVLVLPGDPLRSRLEGIGCEVVEGDVTRPESLHAAVKGADAVLHLAAVLLSKDPGVFDRVNVEGTRNLVAAADAALVGHFVHVSSASVVYPRPTPYSISKQRAEGLVRGRRGPWTIVRPTLVYGDGGGLELMLFWDYLLRLPVVPFIGNGRALKRPVHVDDLSTALLAIPGNQVAFGKTYNLSGPEAVTMEELARLLLRLSGKERPIVHLPAAALERAARLGGRLFPGFPLSLAAVRGVTQDADLDPTESMRDLDWNPVGVREGLPRAFPEGRP